MVPVLNACNIAAAVYGNHDFGKSSGQLGWWQATLGRLHGGKRGHAVASGDRMGASRVGVETFLLTLRFKFHENNNE